MREKEVYLEKQPASSGSEVSQVTKDGRSTKEGLMEEAKKTRAVP